MENERWKMENVFLAARNQLCPSQTPEGLETAQ
jgi:hypothetical protein